MSILALGKQQKKKRKEKFPINEWEKEKKGKKIPNHGSEKHAASTYGQVIFLELPEWNLDWPF